MKPGNGATGHSEDRRRPLAAPEAARLLLDTAEAGGSAAVALVVGGPLGHPWIGTRLAVTSGALPTSSSVLGGVPKEDAAPSDQGTPRGASETRSALTRLLFEALDNPRSVDGLRSLALGDGTELEVYVELRRPVLELVVVGAGHIAQPLARMGASLGYRVSVVDDRPDFATRERFPEAERLVRADFDDPFRDVPMHERTHLVLVTRGHKYDYACLVRALRLDPPPAYVGMIGSRRRVRATYVQLLEEGIDRSLLGRIHAPVGLDIGAETPEEIAVAVAAELVLIRRGGSGRMLKDVERIDERFFKTGKDE